MRDLSTVWKFVEQHYPNYSSCSDIMRNDDLCKIVNGEINGSAEIMFKNEFGSDLSEATAAYNHSSMLIYEKAIQGFIDSRKDDDFEWEEIKFENSVYQCRSIEDLSTNCGNLLVAPLGLKEKLNLDENGDGEFYAVGVDEKICYYATPEEMQLNDTDLYNLIYN